MPPALLLPTGHIVRFRSAEEISFGEVAPLLAARPGREFVLRLAIATCHLERPDGQTMSDRSDILAECDRLFVELAPEVLADWSLIVREHLPELSLLGLVL